MQNEVPLFQKIYDFYKMFYSYIDHFPKKSKEALTVKIEDMLIKLLESITAASYSMPIEKQKFLTEASANVDFLKILFRLCCELKIIDQKKYLLLEEKLQEIGRMIGGWIKSLKTPNR